MTLTASAVKETDMAFVAVMQMAEFKILRLRDRLNAKIQK